MYLDGSSQNSIQLNCLKDQQLKFYMAYNEYKNAILNVRQKITSFNEEEQQYYYANFENDWRRWFYAN